MSQPLASTDLSARVELAHQKAAIPGYSATIAPQAVDIEAWNHVGDPIAEALITYMREHKLMGGDVLATARRLRSEGVDEADAFFTDVEWLPGWIDFDAMRPGAVLGLRYPIGLLLSLHGTLPLTYIDPATARVMASTGRMLRAGADFRRRFWESATGFVAALDVDGMKPGGPGWEQWVRIRILHTNIRMGILRSGRWDLSTSTPISQPATAAGAHIFGRYRANIIKRIGGRVSNEDAESYNLMWRWVARIEGANTELLGATSTDQLPIATRIGDYLYAPNEDSKAATSSLIDGMVGMRKTFGVSRRAHAGVTRALLKEDLVEILPGRDIAADLGLGKDRRADRAGRAVLKVDRGITRLMDMLPSTPDLDLRLTQGAVRRGLGGRPATFRESKMDGDRDWPQLPSR